MRAHLLRIFFELVPAVFITVLSAYVALLVVVVQLGDGSIYLRFLLLALLFTLSAAGQLSMHLVGLLPVLVRGDSE